MSEEAEAAPPVEAPAENATETNTEDTGYETSADSAEDLQNVTPETEAPRTFKVKVDGEEFEVSEDELLKGYSRGTAANKRFEAAAKQRKEIEGVLEAIKDPRRLPFILKELGVDPANVYQLWQEEATAWQNMSEEERARAQFEQERTSFEEERKKYESQKREREVEQAAVKYQEEFERSFTAAAKEAGLPESPRTIMLMAQYAEAALENGYELSPQDLAELVGEEIGQYRKSALDGITIDQLEELVGKDVLNQLRKQDVERVQAKQRTVPNSKPAKPAEAPKSKKRLIATPDELAEWLNGS